MLTPSYSTYPIKPENLNSFLQSSSDEIFAAIKSGRFEELIPGLRQTFCCGLNQTFLGDVAQHTARMVERVSDVAACDSLVKFDSIDRLAALIAHLEKPTVRSEVAPRQVSFVGYSDAAATRVKEISLRLCLEQEQENKLVYLVKNLEVANSWPQAGWFEKMDIVAVPWWRNLRVLQRADAESQSFRGRSVAAKYLGIHWDEIESSRSEYVQLENSATKVRQLK